MEQGESINVCVSVGLLQVCILQICMNVYLLDETAELGAEGRLLNGTITSTAVTDANFTLG